MDKASLVFEAASVSSAMHKGQRYGDRGDYFITHICAVAQMVARMTNDDPEVVAVAYLHDILEDTDYTPSELRRVFGDRIWVAVVLLSKINGETYKFYMENILCNELATKVKIADTLCNLTESVIAGNAYRVGKYTRQLQILHGIIDLEDVV